MVRDAGEGGGRIDPSGWLMTPTPEDAIADEWETIINVRDKVPSLGSFALQVWEEIGGDSIPGVWSDLLAGDWRDVATTAGALRNLSKFCTSYAEAVDLAVAGARYGWEGQASDAMATYFAGLATQVDSLSTQLDGLADRCNDIAFGIYEASVGIEDGIEAIFDLVIAAALSLAAAAASSWTVFGGIAGGAAAAAAILSAIAKVEQVLGAINLAFDIANGTLGVMASLAPGLGATLDVTLPGDYDNRAVS